MVCVHGVCIWCVYNVCGVHVMQVEYSSYGFLDKNRDAMPKSATVLLRCSTNDLIRLLFTGTLITSFSCSKHASGGEGMDKVSDA